MFVIAAESRRQDKKADGDLAADRNAYLHSPLGVEMYGGTEYALSEPARARDGVLARERRRSL